MRVCLKLNLITDGPNLHREKLPHKVPDQIDKSLCSLGGVEVGILITRSLAAHALCVPHYIYMHRWRSDTWRFGSTFRRARF